MEVITHCFTIVVYATLGIRYGVYSFGLFSIDVHYIYVRETSNFWRCLIPSYEEGHPLCISQNQSIHVDLGVVKLLE